MRNLRSEILFNLYKFISLSLCPLSHPSPPYIYFFLQEDCHVGIPCKKWNLQSWNVPQNSFSRTLKTYAFCSPLDLPQHEAGLSMCRFLSKVTAEVLIKAKYTILLIIKWPLSLYRTCCLEKLWTNNIPSHQNQVYCL